MLRSRATRCRFGSWDCESRIGSPAILFALAWRKLANSALYWPVEASALASYPYPLVNFFTIINVCVCVMVCVCLFVLWWFLRLQLFLLSLFLFFSALRCMQASACIHTHLCNINNGLLVMQIYFLLLSVTSLSLLLTPVSWSFGLRTAKIFAVSE